MDEQKEKQIQTETQEDIQENLINERFEKRFSVLEKQRDKTTINLKIIVIGDISVGKTSLIKRYCHNNFTLDYKATIGIDFAQKIMNWDDLTDLKLQIWDIAGHERFGTLTNAYYRGALGGVMVIDATNFENFEDSALRWKNDIDNKVTLSNDSKIPCILVINKIDLENNVDEKKVADFCEKYGFLSWMKISVKENTNISDVFEEITEEIMKLPKNIYSPKEYEDAFTLMEERKDDEDDEATPTNPNNSNCC
eukprot:gene4685-8257_t